MICLLIHLVRELKTIDTGSIFVAIRIIQFYKIIGPIRRVTLGLIFHHNYMAFFQIWNMKKYLEYRSVSFLTIDTNPMPLQEKVYFQMLSAAKVIYYLECFLMFW